MLFIHSRFELGLQNLFWDLEFWCDTVMGMLSFMGEQCFGCAVCCVPAMSLVGLWLSEQTVLA